MTRFLLGALTGLILIGMILVGLSLVFPMAQAPQAQEEVTERATVTEPPETPKPQIQSQVVEPLERAAPSAPEAEEITREVVEFVPDPQVEPLPAPELSPEQVAEARAGYNDLLIKAVSPSLEAPETTDAEAVQAANFAETLRQRTGAVPDATAPDAGSVIELATAPRTSTEPLRNAKTSYFELWDDLMQRCYAVVALQEPLDESGLTPKGDDRINYTEAYSEQEWFAVDKAFSIQVKTRRGDAKSGLLRTCSLKTNRFAVVNKAAVSKLKDQFHDWWERERFAVATETLEYPYKKSPSHRWFGGLTRFGSAQGCPIKVEFSEITIGRETDASLFLTESDKKGCTLSAGSGSGPGGAVRVNRLPQANN